VGGLFPIFEALRAYGDVVALDQRGTGSSEPSLVVSGNWNLPSDKSIYSPEAKQRVIDVAEGIRKAMQDRGIDLAAYNTAESADDVNALRLAVGAEKVVLWAHSYGTHLALAVMKRHGRSIERAILGGVNGLDQRWREPLDGDRLLARVHDLVPKDPAVAKLTPDFLGQVRRVFAQLEKDPILLQRDGATVFIGKAEVQAQLLISSGQLAFVRSLPWLFARLEARSGLDEIADGIQRTIRQRPIGTAMTYAMHVASGVSTDRLARINVQLPASLFGNAVNWLIGDPEFADALAVPDLGEDFRKPFRSDVPALLISGTLDGRTSESDARTVGQEFDRATHVILDGASHDLWTTSPRLLELMLAFIRGESIPDQRIEISTRFRVPD
jgi:pimeloyl-ACP methyl ester carboxylesterase